MLDWVKGLPSELAYGVVTAAALGAGGWLYTRVRGKHGEDHPPQTHNEYHGTVVNVAELHELHLTEAPPPPIPRDLPLAPLGFVNRERDLERLDAVLARAETAPGPVVAVVGGMRGVGKSAIGSQWANQIRKQFSDGDLFADFSRRRNAGKVVGADVLGDFLRDLGTPEVAIPVSLGEKQKLFRRLTAERKMLMLLDDVEFDAQVLDVLPAGAGSVVVVTTSKPLEELLRTGARRFTLKPLEPNDAYHLLAEMAEEERLEADPEATDEVIGVCAGLPIALCVCGARLAAQPGRSVSWLAERIASAPSPLAELSPTGAFETEAVFEFAYSDLPAPAQLLYRRFGLLAELEFTPVVAAALTGIPVEDAIQELESLHATHLLDMPAEDRYRAHELVGQHMAARAETDDSGEEREAATRRLVNWYRAALRRADRAVVGDRLRLSDSVTAEAEGLPSMSDPAAVFSWYEQERRNVMAVLRAAAEREWDDYVWQFAEALWPLCASHKRFPEWIESHEAAIAAALRLGDPTVEARMRSQLARAFAEQGRFQLAEEEMEASRIAVARSDNAMLKASVVEFGGVCLLRAGKTADALRAFEEARSMFAVCGSSRGTALQDYHLGWTLVLAKRYEAALDPLDRARPVMEGVPDAISVGRILVRKGEALGHLHRGDEAQETLDEAVATLESVGIWYERAEAYEAMAEIAVASHEPDLARNRLQQAYRIYREFGHPRADDLLSELGGG